MKGLGVEARPEHADRPFAQIEEPFAPEPVGGPIAGPNCEPVHFCGGHGRAEPGCLHQIGDGLVAAPAFVMNAGIGNQPRSAQQHGLQVPDAAERIIGIEPQLVGKRLRIGAPALGIGHQPDQLARQRQVGRTQNAAHQIFDAIRAVDEAAQRLHALLRCR